LDKTGEQGANQYGATTRVIKRGDEECFGGQVILKRGDGKYFSDLVVNEKRR
jgi:hypothetical protein